MGVAYSFYAAAVWPAVVYVVNEDQVGTAYGLVTAVQNTGLALVPQLVGLLVKTNPDCDPSKDAGGYFDVELMFMIFGACGVLIGVYIHTVPEGRSLNLQDPWSATEDYSKVDDDANPLSDSCTIPAASTMAPRPSDKQTDKQADEQEFHACHGTV